MAAPCVLAQRHLELPPAPEESLRRVPPDAQSRPPMGRGTIRGMRTTIDAVGRIVIPKAIRREAGFAAGMALDIELKDGRVQIEGAHQRVELIQEGHLLVAHFPDTTEPLPEDIVGRLRAGVDSEGFGAGF